MHIKFGKTYFAQIEVQCLVHAPTIIRKAHNTSQCREMLVPPNAFMSDDAKVSARLSEPDNNKLKQ